MVCGTTTDGERNYNHADLKELLENLFWPSAPVAWLGRRRMGNTSALLLETLRFTDKAWEEFFMYNHSMEHKHKSAYIKVIGNVLPQ